MAVYDISSANYCNFDNCSYWILLLQFITNDNDTPMIDPETCELYILDSQINSKSYLDEFNQKCLDFKNLNK